jgi:Domain of unknown function (DUF5753)
MERCAAHPADTHLSGVTTPCAPIRPSRRTRTHAVNTHRARPRHPGSPRRVPAPPRVRTRPNSDLRSDRLTQADRPTTVDTLDVEGVMRGRLARQAILYQPEHHIVIALGEAALRNIHGDPDVQRQQLGTCTSSPNNPRRASGGTRRIGLARPARVRSPRRPGHPRRRRRSTPPYRTASWPASPPSSMPDETAPPEALKHWHLSRNPTKPLKSHQQFRSSRRPHPAHQRARNAPVPSTQ